MTLQKFLTYPFLQILNLMARAKDESLVVYAEHLERKNKAQRLEPGKKVNRKKSNR